MSEQFTKGPWSVLPLEDDKEYIRIRGTVLGGRYKIADVHDMHFAASAEYAWVDAEREESKANAALIACALEMYDMLKDLLGNSSFNVEHSDAADKIELMLAKARGEQ